MAAAAVGAASVFLLRLVPLRNAAPKTSLETLQKGLGLHREGRYQEAIREFTRVIDTQRGFPEAYVFRGIALHNVGQFSDAVRDFSKALELDTQNLTVRLYRGESYLAMGQQEAAAEDFMAVVRANPEDKRLVAAAKAKLQAMGR